MGRTGGRRERRQRPHKPDVLGPRLFRRGRWWGCDLRPWGMGRVTMRDPSHPAWPDKGERTEDPTVAEKWRWQYMALAQGQIKRKQLGLPAHKTLAEAREELIAYRERHGFAAATLRNDLSAIRALADIVGWDYPLADVRVRDVQHVIDTLVDAGYSATTIQTYQVHLSHLFRWAGIRPNPARKRGSENDEGVTVPITPERDIFTWSDEEIERLRRAADEVDRERFRYARLMLETGLATGARFRELLALRWEDFDPRMRTVRIARQVDGYRGRETRAPKSRKGRTAVVLPFFWEHYRPERGYVLPSTSGGPMHSKMAEAILKDVLKRAGLDGPGRSFHDLRRTYGRLFLEMGGWMDELQRSLGHKSIRTTEQQYGKFQEDVAAQFAVDRMYGEGRARRLRVVE